MIATGKKTFLNILTKNLGLNNALSPRKSVFLNEVNRLVKSNGSVVEDFADGDVAFGVVAIATLLPSILRRSFSNADSRSPDFKKNLSAPCLDSPPFNLTSCCRFCLNTFMSLAMPGIAMELFAITVKSVFDCCDSILSDSAADSRLRSVDSVGSVDFPFILPLMKDEIISGPPKKELASSSLALLLEKDLADVALKASPNPFPPDNSDKYFCVKVAIFYLFLLALCKSNLSFSSFK